MRILVAAALLALAAPPLPPTLAADMEITPFRSVNQSPLAQIFGLPAASSATITPSGRLRLALDTDVANSYSTDSSKGEQVTLDGESYRWVLSASYGLDDRFEVGIDLPYVLYGGGFLDGFIIDWHEFFGLSQGGRKDVERGRLLYSYSKNGEERLKMTHAGSGIGDITLTAGMKLYDAHDGNSHDSLALRGTLKLPSGDSGSLRGSGSVDGTLSLCGSMNSFTEWGALGLYGSLGGMAMTDGDVLSDQQNNLVGLGTAGLGWGPAEWISFKFQFNANSPLYHGSSLDQISGASLMLIMGGALRFPGNYLLDIGVSEDLAVSTAPDVGFHFGLSRQF